MQEKLDLGNELVKYVREEGVINSDYAYSTLMKLIESGLVEIEKIDFGFIMYMITPELNGKKSLSEVFFYIPKENRGNGRLVLKMLKRFEDAARENDCDYLKVGANYGLNDDKFISLLERKGFKTDTLYKEIK